MMDIIKKTKRVGLLFMVLLLLMGSFSGCVAIRHEWEEHFGKTSSMSEIKTLECEEFSEQMTVVLEYYHGKENELLTTEEYLLSKEDTKLLLDALKPNEIEFKVGHVLKMIMEKAYNVYLNDNQILRVYGILDGTNSDGYVFPDSLGGGGYVGTSVVKLLEEIVDRSELVKSVVLDLKTGEEVQTFPEVES